MGSNIFTFSDIAKHFPKTRSHSMPKNLTLGSRLHELIISIRQSSSSKVCLELGPVMSNKIRHCLLGMTSLQMESTVSFASCSSAPSCTIRRIKTYKKWSIYLVRLFNTGPFTIFKFKLTISIQT